jgi:hypothetical protein
MVSNDWLQLQLRQAEAKAKKKKNMPKVPERNPKKKKEINSYG